MSAKQVNDMIDTNILIEQCRSGDPLEQVHAVMALEKAGVKQAVDAILALLPSPDEGVRSAAVDALGHLGSKRVEAVGPALEALLRDPEELVRSGAAESLGRIGYAPARTALEGVLLQDNEWLVRASAAEALGELDDTCALAALTEALNDEDAPVRSYAASSIGLLGDPTALSVLRGQLLIETYPPARGSLMVAALRLGDESALDRLIVLLDTLEEEFTTNLHNAIDDMLSRKTPPIVVGRAAELDQRLTRLGSTSLQERLAELVRAADSDTP